MQREERTSGRPERRCSMIVQYEYGGGARGHRVAPRELGGGLFIRSCPESGRGDPSANGNPTHVCVRHLRVNGADGRNGRMSSHAKATLPFQASAHGAWSMPIDGTEGNPYVPGS